MQPYRALACAVILQAIEDALLSDRSTAAGWLQSTSDMPLTFRWWCLVACMDPDNILNNLGAFNVEYAMDGTYWDVLNESKGA